MAELLTEIARAKLREQILAWDKNEAALAAQLVATLPLTKKVPDDETLKLAQIFIAWCTEHGVRHTPAKPTSAAKFILSVSGAGDERILALVAAIQELHRLHNLSDPTGTPIVEAALNQVIQIEPPRSWNKGEKAEFLLLSVGARAAISRRENQREKEIRRMQNASASQLRQTNGAGTKPVEPKAKDLQNGKAA